MAADAVTAIIKYFCKYFLLVGVVLIASGGHFLVKLLPYHQNSLKTLLQSTLFLYNFKETLTQSATSSGNYPQLSTIRDSITPPINKYLAIITYYHYLPPLRAKDRVLKDGGNRRALSRIALALIANL
jgi:hypothetical protein